MITSIYNLKDGDKFTTIDGQRGQKEVNSYFIFAKGKRNRGYRYSINNDFNVIIKDENDKAREWERRVKTVIKKLENSGLWVDLLEQYKNLLLLGYENKEKLKHLEELSWKETISNNDFICQIEKKYPFAIKTGTDGKRRIDTFYIWEQSDVKLKSMYFGLGANRRIKENLKNAIEEKKDFHYYTRTSYDVTIEYNSKRNMAWYSEEYKDCGNGHYYLAIDENTALFCEND